MEKEGIDAEEEGNIAKVQAIAKDFGTQIFITGTGQANAAGVKEIHGQAVAMYNCDAMAKMYYTDTAQLLASKSIPTQRGGARGYHTISPQAGKKAFLDAVEKASPILMEPVVKAIITVPSHCAGGVTGDLSSMRGMVTGTETLPHNRIAVSGQVPLKEMQEYHSRLKSLSDGEGNFTMDFSHYAEVAAETAGVDAQR